MDSTTYFIAIYVRNRSYLTSCSFSIWLSINSHNL